MLGVRAGADAAAVARWRRGPSSPGRRRWPAATAPAYGCAFAIGGELKRFASRAPLMRRPHDPQRLRLPRRADSPRSGPGAGRLRDEDRHPAAAGGNEPVRIAETEAGMLNSIGLANPGIDSCRRSLAPPGRTGGPDLGVRGEDSQRTTTRISAGSSTGAGGRSGRAEPLLPKRRRARRLRGRDRGGRTRSHLQEALREALAVGSGHRFGLRGGGGGWRGRPLAREHAPRPGARPPDARADAFHGHGGLSGPALRPVALAAVFVCLRATGLPIVGMGGLETGGHALELIAAGAALRARDLLFSDPGAPGRIRAELAEAEALGLR